MSSALTPALAASAALALLPFPVLCRVLPTQDDFLGPPPWLYRRTCRRPRLLGAAREAGCGREPWAVL